MENKNKFISYRSRKILIAAVLVAGIFSWLYVALNMSSLRPRTFYLHNYYRQPIVVKDISSWMTFDYINKVFHLPPSYLKDVFKISDQKYPRITIEQLSKETKASSTILIKNIQNDIVIYFSSSTNGQ